MKWKLVSDIKTRIGMPEDILLTDGIHIMTGELLLGEITSEFIDKDELDEFRWYIPIADIKLPKIKNEIVNIPDKKKKVVVKFDF